MDETGTVQPVSQKSPQSPKRLCLRPPAASLIGSDVRCKAAEGRAEAWEAKFPERDASVPRRTASQQASLTPLSGPRVSPARGGNVPRKVTTATTWQKDEGGAKDAQPRAGRPKRGADRRLLLSAAGGRLQSPRGAREGESKEDGELRTAYPSAAPNSMPAVWRRGPRLVNVASGLAHRSAQHLTPLRGRPFNNRKAEAMEREGASSSALRTDALGEGQFLRARGPCAAGPSSQGRPGGKQPRRGGHTAHAQNEPSSSPSQKHVPGLNRDQRNQRFRSHPMPAFARMTTGHTPAGRARYPAYRSPYMNSSMFTCSPPRSFDVFAASTAASEFNDDR